MHSNFNDLRTEIMTAKEIIIKNKELFEQEPYKEMYNGDVNAIEKCMEEYHQDKLKLLRIGVVSQQREMLEWLSNEDYFNIPKDEISEILDDWQTYNSNCG